MKKILVVEVDKKISMALKIRLRSAGFQVLQAFDTISGTSMAKKYQPDVILLDISMPGGDGFDVAERVRDVIGCSAAIIFVTAHKEPELRKRAIEEFGAAGFFEKPYDSRALLDTVEKSVI